MKLNCVSHSIIICTCGYQVYYNFWYNSFNLIRKYAIIKTIKINGQDFFILMQKQRLTEVRVVIRKVDTNEYVLCQRFSFIASISYSIYVSFCRIIYTWQAGITGGYRVIRNQLLHWVSQSQSGVASAILEIYCIFQVSDWNVLPYFKRKVQKHVP